MATTETNDIAWGVLSDTYGFLGNSLLKPMSQTSSIGLEKAFWEEFPSFGDARVADAVKACAQAAAHVVADAKAGFADPVQRCSVEYTRLFVGPPAPAAPPWETMYRGQDVTVGFGQATFEMRALLREAGLEMAGQSNQYEDHLGIELLYLSVLCSRVYESEANGPVPDACAVAAYMDEHPLSWAGNLHDRIAEQVPGGYFAALTSLVHAVLAWHRVQLTG